MKRTTVAKHLLTDGPVGTGIVHLGLGNFHRAHQAVYTAQAGDGWGILGVASRSTAVADAMNAQDGLYSVLELSPEGSSISVPGVHTGAIVAAGNPAAVVDAIAAAETRIVSTTVTEHGYCMDPGTHRLDLNRVAADLHATPQTVIGQLGRALERRAATHRAPITVLNCDNMQSNGAQTRSLVLEFLQAAGSTAIDWVAEHVTFPNSMVDRIVPATTEAYRETAAQLLGVHDRIPVPAEPFTMWVMEDRFAAGRPAWERGGASFSAEVEAYELLKLRLLNGTHSLIAYLGALDGHATIPDARGADFIEAAARAVLEDDYLPTVTLPQGFELKPYVDSLFDRWSNHSLGHRTQQVGSDGSVKLPQRIPEPARQLLAQGEMPEHLALTVAAWICCVVPLPGFDPGPHARTMVDPARERLGALAADSRSTEDLVRTVLTQVFPTELAESNDFARRVAEYVAVVIRDGVRTAARMAARSRTSRPQASPAA
ncbi:mannitol dehydrogenase family protein [Kribbella jejuensis]|uniref:Mannitol-1-phosphate 5-dehydrogenase n=1 Tax=Kribbella jejuensis TaxID=236068 RepID=A0A542EM11_9ACTN|nr:mannitol dehydrogenase family protein [Kribbella jejuensis]TQJ16381.1 fructuronate reductase [Kribbella jejuensis]